MSLIQLLFGKRINEITVEDLTEYFKTPRLENDKIEFKSFEVSASGKNDLAERERRIMETICGFLNSEGGILIWGAPKTKNFAGENVCEGNLTPFDTSYQKDQFIAKIADSIIPSPQGIIFRNLKINDKFIYLFEIAKSDYSPHQFRDKYYMRMDGQTKAAPHHYIEALFKKIGFPNLQAFLRLDKYEHVTWSDDLAVLHCSIILRNQSPYLNDFNVHYRAFSTHGAIFSAFDPVNYNLTRENLKHNGDYLNDRVAETLYYGNWIDSRFKIVLSRAELHSMGYSLDIRVQFGAKHSPMKICLYKLIIGESIEENLQEHIIEMTENRFFNIHEESMELPDQERLFNTLGRTYHRPE